MIQNAQKCTMAFGKRYYLLGSALHFESVRPRLPR